MMNDEMTRRCFDALVIVQSLASVMGGPLDDATLYIEHAREANRHERPFSERIENELLLALSHIRDLQRQARAVLGDTEETTQP